jgi:hypothetical protein
MTTYEYERHQEPRLLFEQTQLVTTPCPDGLGRTLLAISEYDQARRTVNGPRVPVIFQIGKARPSPRLVTRKPLRVTKAV